jgi:hypothetical protein
MLMKKLLLTSLILMATRCLWAQDETTNITDPRLILNGGNIFTKSQTIELKIEALGARKMMVSNTQDFNGIAWREYTTEAIQWKLTDGEGEKTVFAKLQDKFGKESELLEKRITFDKTPPKKPEVQLLADNGFANNPERLVTLKVMAEDARYMMVSNSKDFLGAKWQGYRTTTNNWKLEGLNDGIKRVYIKLMDGARNESEVAIAEINVDSQPPIDPKISINGDQKVTTDKEGKVQVVLFVRGGTEMMVSNDKMFKDGQWQAYHNNPIPWQLAGREGENVVFAKFRDAAGNESMPAAAAIFLDNIPPTETAITINGGAKYCEHPDRIVQLGLQAKGAKLMMISNNKDFAGARWEAYVPQVNVWKLVGDNGEKTVYAKFKDAAGNESAPVSAVITLAL